MLREIILLSQHAERKSAQHAERKECHKSPERNNATTCWEKKMSQMEK